MKGGARVLDIGCSSVRDVEHYVYALCVRHAGGGVVALISQRRRGRGMRLLEVFEWIHGGGGCRGVGLGGVSWVRGLGVRGVLVGWGWDGW
jgi:hypothetical protein